MKNIFFFLTICCFSNNLLHAQVFEWASNTEGGSSMNNGLTLDPSGNIYSTGYFQDTINLNSSTTQLFSNGGHDIYVLKQNANGGLAWAKSFGSTGNDQGYDIATDASGNVYITGYFTDTINFDPGLSNTTLYPQGNYDSFVLKLNSSGNFVWVKKIAGPRRDWGWAIATDNNGDIISTGIFQDTIDIDPGAGTQNLVASSTSQDMYIQKLNSNGDLIWAKHIGGISNEYPYDVSCDNNNNILLTGFFEDTVDFDPSISTYYLNTNGLRDIFIQKLDANGNFVWAKGMGGITNDNGTGIITDNSGNVYTTGTFFQRADFDPGPDSSFLQAYGLGDIFIQKLDANGNFVWVKQLGGTQNESGKDIALDASGNVYTTGWYQGTVDFDPSIDSNKLSSNGGFDIFIHNMDNNGNFLWASSMGDYSTDQGIDIVVDAQANVYTSGWFLGTVDFNPGISNYDLSSSPSMRSAFIQKLNNAAINVKMIDNQVNVSTYPNPSHAFINIAFEKNMKDIELTLTNIQGKIITQEYYEDLLHTQMQLGTTNGIYFLTIRSKNFKQTIKLIKQ